MKFLSCLLLLLSAFVFGTISCKNSDDVIHSNPPNLRALSEAETTLVSANAEFAFSLLKSVVAETGGNVFLSPLSVSTALGMTVNGAEGETLDGILHAIQYDGMTPAQVNQGYQDLTGLLRSMDNTTTLSLGNGIWYDPAFTVNPDFAKAVSTYYDGKAEELTTADAINQWVEEKTDHRIKNLLGPLGDEVMILVNTIYFKGEWASKFDKSATKPEGFITTGGNTVTTDMMHAHEISVHLLTNDDLTLLDLPYGNGQYSMTILMPRQMSLPDFTATLNEQSFNNWLSLTSEREASVVLPKFKMSWKAKLNGPLSDMGMSAAFSDGASFPGLFTGVSGGLKISYVLHQSSVEVDEEGSVAAAATAVGVIYTSVPTPVEVRIDHPFVFMIREKHTGVILFLGQFAAPPAP